MGCTFGAGRSAMLGPLLDGVGRALSRSLGGRSPKATVAFLSTLLLSVGVLIFWINTFRKSSGLLVPRSSRLVWNGLATGEAGVAPPCQGDLCLRQCRGPACSDPLGAKQLRLRKTGSSAPTGRARAGGSG